MAGPTLGTLLIQRLDAALGTTLSQQTQIVNRASSNPVPHPGQATRTEPVPNTLVRDTRENVDRALLNRPGVRVDLPQGTNDPAATGRTTGHSVTTSATTSLGLAARIILNLFSSHTTNTPPIQGRTPLTGTAPHVATTSATPGSGAAGAAQTTPSGPITGAAPGTESTSMLAQNLARALTQNLQQSGLFYESHLKGLVSGQYRLADIRQEPQAQIPGGTRPDAGPGASSASGQTAQTSQAQLAQGASASSNTGAQAGSPSASTAQGTTGQSLQANLATSGIDPATHAIVRQQLEALADQSIHWRGEAWPGTPMDWHVRRHTENEHGTAPDTEPDASWQSQLKIQLPRLGDVTMGIRVAGKQVYVTVQADENTAPLLQQHAGELYDQMSGRQLELTAITFLESEARPGHDAQGVSPEPGQHSEQDPGTQIDADGGINAGSRSNTEPPV